MEKYKILFVDACISARPHPRTPRLCRAYLDLLAKALKEQDVPMSLETVRVNGSLVLPLDESNLRQREAFVKNHDYTSPMFRLARQFANADYIVIGAPYWDLSFPAALKAYLEHITVSGLTFASTPTGLKGLCNAEQLVYLTTAGGIIGDKNLGYEYVRQLADMLGITNTLCFYADGLDLEGNQPDAILEETIRQIEELDEGVFLR